MNTSIRMTAVLAVLLASGSGIPLWAAGGQRGIERWTYRRGQVRAASAEFIVAFIRDESLDWKLSTNGDLIQPSFPGTGANDPAFAGIENRTTRNANNLLPAGSQLTLP